MRFFPFGGRELCNKLAAFWRVRSRDANVRSMPSASTMSVTLAQEASAFTMRASRSSSRDSATAVGCGLLAAFLRFTLANRHE